MARCDGNPFFAEELLTAAAADDQFRELPRGLRELLLQRVAELDAPTQSLLRLAAAAGRDVGRGLLCALAARPDRDVHASLRDAVEHGVLVPVEANGRLRFRHALLAEAVYATILPGEREELHAKLAEGTWPASVAGRRPGTSGHSASARSRCRRASARANTPSACRAASTDAASASRLRPAAAQCGASSAGGAAPRGRPAERRRPSAPGSPIIWTGSSWCAPRSREAAASSTLRERTSRPRAARRARITCSVSTTPTSRKFRFGSDAGRTPTPRWPRAWLRRVRPEAAAIRVQLSAKGLRAQAELAGLARARRNDDGVRDRLRAHELLETAQRSAAEAAPTTPEASAWLLLAEAECLRARAEARPEAWAQAATNWERLERPPLAAYCWWREAEALVASGASRTDASAPLGKAHGIAARLGAKPLLGEIELLAERARLVLAAPDAAGLAEEPGLAQELGLTTREADVLTLVARGYTNREISDELVISVKTASVHVSHILQKLNVPNRREAAAILHRLAPARPARG